MPLTAHEKSGSTIEPVESGVHIGICYGVIDLGTHENKVFGGDAHKILIQWELPDCRGEFEKDGEKKDMPRVISKRYTLSLSEKANLRRDLESWRGRKFTPQELAGFDLKNLLGVTCQLQIVHETAKDGRTFANVAAVMALPKGTPRPTKTENPLTFFSFEDAGPAPKLPDLPEWIRKIIMESREWNQAVANTPAPADQSGEEEDDIPF